MSSSSSNSNSSSSTEQEFSLNVQEDGTIHLSGHYDDPTTGVFINVGGVISSITRVDNITRKGSNFTRYRVVPRPCIKNELEFVSDGSGDVPKMNRNIYGSANNSLLGCRKDIINSPFLNARTLLIGNDNNNLYPEVDENVPIITDEDSFNKHSILTRINDTISFDDYSYKQLAIKNNDNLNTSAEQFTVDDIDDEEFNLSSDSSDSTSSDSSSSNSSSSSDSTSSDSSSSDSSKSTSSTSSNSSLSSSSDSTNSTSSDSSSSDSSRSTSSASSDSSSTSSTSSSSTSSTSSSSTSSTSSSSTPSSDTSQTSHSSSSSRIFGSGLEWDVYSSVASLDPVTSGIFERTEPIVADGFPILAGEENTGYVFEGFIKLPNSQSYTFYTSSDDNSRLWVNNVLVVDNWFEQAPTERSGVISLSGGIYQFRIESSNISGTHFLQCRVESATIPKQLIPLSWIGTLENESNSSQSSLSNSSISSSSQTSQTSDTSGSSSSSSLSSVSPSSSSSLNDVYYADGFGNTVNGEYTRSTSEYGATINGRPYYTYTFLGNDFIIDYFLYWDGSSSWIIEQASADGNPLEIQYTGSAYHPEDAVWVPDNGPSPGGVFSREPFSSSSSSSPFDNSSSSSSPFDTSSSLGQTSSGNIVLTTTETPYTTSADGWLYEDGNYWITFSFNVLSDGNYDIIATDFDSFGVQPVIELWSDPTFTSTLLATSDDVIFGIASINDYFIPAGPVFGVRVRLDDGSQTSDKIGCYYQSS